MLLCVSLNFWTHSWSASALAQPAEGLRRRPEAPQAALASSPARAEARRRRRRRRVRPLLSADDVVKTLEGLSLIKYWKGDHIISVTQKIVEEHLKWVPAPPHAAPAPERLSAIKRGQPPLGSSFSTPHTRTFRAQYAQCLLRARFLP